MASDLLAEARLLDGVLSRVFTRFDRIVSLLMVADTKVIHEIEMANLNFRNV